MARRLLFIFAALFAASACGSVTESADDGTEVEKGSIEVQDLNFDGPAGWVSLPGDNGDEAAVADALAEAAEMIGAPAETLEVQLRVADWASFEDTGDNINLIVTPGVGDSTIAEGLPEMVSAMEGLGEVLDSGIESTALSEETAVILTNNTAFGDLWQSSTAAVIDGKLYNFTSTSTSSIEDAEAQIDQLFATLTVD